MTPTLTLTQGLLRCDLLPAVGGSLGGLWYQGRGLLRALAPDFHSGLQTASYPLLPYSNRIGHCRLHWDGQDYLLPPNFAPEPHCIHGVGWQRAWQVLDSGPSHALLAYRHAGDAAWPFAFESQQHFALQSQSLEMRLSITNRADKPAPVGMGWHPYFVKGPQTRLQFTARARWEMGPDKLPSQRLQHAGLDGDCSELDLDHCFDGWAGQVLLSDAHHRLRLESDLDCLVVYTTPTLDCIAVEPVSHVNNALALAQARGQTPQSLGLRVLQPGETFAASMNLHIEETA